jgi:hypothetical protein
VFNSTIALINISGSQNSIGMTSSLIRKRPGLAEQTKTIHLVFCCQSYKHSRESVIDGKVLMSRGRVSLAFTRD